VVFWKNKLCTKSQTNTSRVRNEDGILSTVIHITKDIIILAFAFWFVQNMFHEKPQACLLNHSYVIQPQGLHEKCIFEGCLITVHEAPTLTKMTTMHISFENNWLGTGWACDISHFCNPLSSFPNSYPAKPRRKWRSDKETDMKRENKLKKRANS
jgi:hypothetical protein